MIDKVLMKFDVLFKHYMSLSKLNTPSLSKFKSNLMYNTEIYSSNHLLS